MKLNEHYEISFRSMKNYLDEIFMDKLRSIKFPDCSKHICVNDAHQDFVTQFLSEVDSVLPIRTLKVKYNTKPWFNINVLNAIQMLLNCFCGMVDRRNAFNLISILQKIK